MGKATRWLKGLLGRKEKDIDKDKDNASSTPVSQITRKDEKRWSFGGKSVKDNTVNSSQIPSSTPSSLTDSNRARLKSYMANSESAQNKHAIAVAAATAAAADAAVAAAQAAVAVVRLTQSGGGRKKYAAVKIQTVFRGYLARKALRALKSLVKLQAVVRGYLVRKRAEATLQCMQALLRAQTSVRTQRVHRSINKENKFRKSTERIDESRSQIHSKRLSYEPNSYDGDNSPKIVEIDTYRTRSRSRRINVAALSEFIDDPYYQVINSSSPLQAPPRISTHNSRNIRDFELCECKCPTAQSTPRFTSFAPPTPAKSVCGDVYIKPYSNFSPSYMANTQSFKAKSRSSSAPKQRPEPGAKKRISLNEMMAARNSTSGVRMFRSALRLHEAIEY